MAERVAPQGFTTLSQQRKRTITVVLENEYISIKTPGVPDYDIPLEDVKTHKQLIEWIHHITEKTWVSGEVVHDIIDAAIHANKLPFYGENQ